MLLSPPGVRKLALPSSDAPGWSDSRAPASVGVVCSVVAAVELAVELIRVAAAAGGQTGSRQRDERQRERHLQDPPHSRRDSMQKRVSALQSRGGFQQTCG
jgi:hypothetical protein